MSKFNNIAQMTAIVAGVSSIMSCSTTWQAKESISNASESINQLSKQVESGGYTSKDNFSRDMNRIYVSNTPIKRKDTEKLPPKFMEPLQIDGSYNNMRQVADLLQRLTGYPVLLDLDNASQYVRLTQTRGNLIDVLNNLCAQTDTSWSYLNGKLVISELETQTFFIKALPGDVMVQNQVNSNSGISSSSTSSLSAGSGGGGGGGGNTSSSSNDQNTIQSVQFNLNHSIWVNLSDTLKGMLSKSGSMSVSPSTSSITVIDKPSRILKVAQYIEKQNDMLRQQVQVDVQVMTVETNAEDNYMINWNIVLGGTDASFNMNGMAGAGSPSASGLVPVFAPSATTQSFTVAAKSGSLSGSQLVANALSTMTKSSLVTSAAATTLNNQPVPIQIVEQQGYVSGVSVTQVMAAGSQQSITTGQLSYGFTLNVLPTIEKSGLVNLQLSLNLSSLKALKNFTLEGGSMVQLPDMIQRNAMQKVTMRDGDTYVTTGFDSDFNLVSEAGVGSPSFWLFGGGISAQKSRQKVVIMVTPRVIKM
ncbi:MAG: secretin N-terminal domain-containing protein [Burkholderiales bacterium]|nr:secretin N-terminal domain-containing protein [Burkholderiales bacterium]